MEKMTNCKICGAEIAKSAKICPKCGAKRKKHTLLGIVLCAVGVILLICALASGSGDKPEKETGNAAAAEQKTETLFSVGETAVFGRIKVTANEICTTKGTDFFVPEKGNIFVGINFTVENIADKDVAMSTLLLFDAYVDGTKCQWSLNGTCAFDASNKTLDGTISPGKKLTGWYCAEVPENWKELELQVSQDFLSSSSNSAKFVFHP